MITQLYTRNCGHDGHCGIAALSDENLLIIHCSWLAGDQVEMQIIAGKVSAKALQMCAAEKQHQVTAVKTQSHVGAVTYTADTAKVVAQLARAHAAFCLVIFASPQAQKAHHLKPRKHSKELIPKTRILSKKTISFVCCTRTFISYRLSHTYC